MNLYNYIFYNILQKVMSEKKLSRVQSALSKKDSKKSSSTSTLKLTTAKRVNFEEKTFKRNFITPARAMTEFLLKPSQLADLPRTRRRSPYVTEPSILVYTRQDVEQRALQIWGSLENLQRHKQLRDQDKKTAESYQYEAKKLLREARRSLDNDDRKLKSSKCNREAVVVCLAIAIDLLNFCFKLVVTLITLSDSMLAETVHSGVDTLNEFILGIGVFQATQKANASHPYGYSNMKYVTSLISGVGLFCLGAGIALYEGITSLVTEKEEINIEEIKWAFIVLAFGLCTEGFTLINAVVACVRGAKISNMSIWHYIYRGEEPGVNVVLLEDFAAVLGIFIATGTLTATWMTGNKVPDAAGSVAIGVLLGVVATFLIVTNSTALVGRSISSEKLERINKKIEEDVMIRAIYDVKGIDMGNNLVRYKAEIDFDGAQLTRLYLDRLDLNDLLTAAKGLGTIDDLEAFMVNHGEAIVDLIGSEIDRIEVKIRRKFPEIRHVDLEIL